MTETFEMSPYQPVIDPLVIGERQFTSRLMLGTGKYKNLDEAKKSITASGCQILTVAVRRHKIRQYKVWEI